jgi:hypothetical protein
MDERLEVTGPYSVSSTEGFVVEVQSGGVLYRDASGEASIEFEYLGKPPGMLLYKPTQENKRAKDMDQARIDSIMSRVVRALQHLGWYVELW